MSKEQKLFAIWKYDQPPYYIGGAVKEVLEDGYVRAENYDGMKFKYHKLYPLKEGQEKYNKLKEAAQEYKDAKDVAHAQMLVKIDKIIL